MSDRVYRSPRAIAAASVVLAAPLAFPTTIPAVTAIALAGVIALQGYLWVARPVPPPQVPFDWPWAILVVQALIATAVSAYPGVSLPRLTAILLGSILVRAMTFTTWTDRDIDVGMGLATAGALLVVLTGLTATEWLGYDGLHRKLFIVAPLVRLFPRRVPWGINPNAMAAATLFFIPLMTMQVVRAFRREPGRVLAEPGSRRRVRRQLGIVALPILIGLVLVLVLTVSRSAWVGLAIVTGLGVFWAWRSVRAVVLVAVVVVATVAVSGVTPASLLGSSAAVRDGALIPATSRTQLWARALHFIAQAPVTGIGLDTFRIRAQEASPPFAGASSIDVVHAHNVFLQTAMDLGLPGLIAFLALLWISAAMWKTIDRWGAPGDRLLAFGIAGNLLAVTIFGLYDAVALGTKLSLCFWWNLGLLAVLHQRARLEMEKPR